VTLSALVEQTVRRLPLFAHLGDEVLERHVLVGEELRLRRGDVLVEQGEPSLGFDLLLEGKVEFASESGGQRVHVITFTPPAFWGHEPLMADVPVPVTGLALADSRVYRLSPDRFWAMVGACPSILRQLVRTVAERYQTLGANTELQMRLVSLGTMSAGLAHELNNPAAAARRASAELATTLEDQARAALALAASAPTAESLAGLAAVLDDARVRAGALPAGEDTLERADREDELVEWLEALEPGGQASEHADALADGGFGREDLEPALAGLDPAQAATVVGFLATLVGAGRLASEVLEATSRMSDLVISMRNYSRLDEAPEQEVDLRRGLEDTLKVLGPKLTAGVAIERDYDETLPPVPGWPGELNQVWTNLVDNAVDAVEGHGRLRIATTRRGDRAIVTVADDGPGIPDDVRERIFDPFFTTKPVGLGVGLGLDIARRIVAGRHRGELRVTSTPGDTRFEVSLPLRAG